MFIIETSVGPPNEPLDWKNAALQSEGLAYILKFFFLFSKEIQERIQKILVIFFLNICFTFTCNIIYIINILDKY